MATIPKGIIPLVSPFTHGAPGGAMRTEVAGGAPRYGLDYDRGVQQYSVTILLDEFKYTIWQLFFQRVIALGTLTFEMELDSGFGCQPHQVNIVPGTYNVSVTGSGTHRLATFTVEAESTVYDLTDAEVQALLDYYEQFGSDRRLIDRIAQFANVDTLVLNF